MKHSNSSLLRACTILAILLFAWASPAMAQTPDGTNGQGDQPTPLYSGCGGVTAPAINNDYEQSVIEMANNERAKNGLPPLKRVPGLTNSARYHSTDMGQDNYFDHNTFDRISGGQLVSVCSWSSRIATFYNGVLRENIGAGFNSPNSVMYDSLGWMNSAGHRANILSTDSWEIGVGYYQGSGSFGTYWTMDFGRTAGVYPLIIKGDSAKTSTRSINIYAYGSWDTMSLRNDGGAWGTELPFQNSFSWLIPNGIGTHTVEARLTNSSGQVTTSDSIYLDTNDPPVLSGLPGNVDFIYSIPDHKLIPQSYRVEPADGKGREALYWSLQSQGNWFGVSSTSGITPDAFSITPTDWNASAPGTYTGSVTVVAQNPTMTAGSPRTIHVTLSVVNKSFQYDYLPMIPKVLSGK